MHAPATMSEDPRGRLPPLGLNESDPEALLCGAVRHYGGRIALATSLGPQTLVCLDILARHGLARTVPIFFLDTGLLFDETYALRRRVEARYGVTIDAVTAEIDLYEQARLYGGQLWARAPDACCALRKVEPLRRALAGLDAWITGVRRDQSATRAAAGAIDWDPQFELIKVSPLAAWSRADVDAYIAEHDVPYNPLLAQGYRSVGCGPCTRATGAGDERAGRWAGRGKTECGIHLASAPGPSALRALRRG